MAVIKVQDMRGPYLVFDGEFLEKLPAGESAHRRHVSEFTQVDVEHKPARKRLFGGQTEEHWRATIHCGSFFSIWVSAEEKPTLDALSEALSAAAGR